MPAPTVVAAAAPLWVRRHVDGPRQQAAVVHSGPHAVYVAVSEGRTRRCVGVLSACSSFVPCGMRTTQPDLRELFGDAHAPSAGDAASIGGGVLELGSGSVRVGRTVDASVPSIAETEAAVMADRLRTAMSGRDAAVRTELSATSLTLLEDGDPSAVSMLLGRGGGLTPVGDDVLCGWLALLAATGRGSSVVAQVVADTAAQSTTLLSTTLLDRAVEGEVLPEFRRMIARLRQRTDDDPAALGSAVDDVVGVGHTSGVGMLLGCLIALDHLTHSNPREPRS